MYIIHSRRELRVSAYEAYVCALVCQSVKLVEIERVCLTKCVYVFACVFVCVCLSVSVCA